MLFLRCVAFCFNFAFKCSCIIDWIGLDCFLSVVYVSLDFNGMAQLSSVGHILVKLCMPVLLAG